MVVVVVEVVVVSRNIVNGCHGGVSSGRDLAS